MMRSLYAYNGFGVYDYCLRSGDLIICNRMVQELFPQAAQRHRIKILHQLKAFKGSRLIKLKKHPHLRLRPLVVIGNNHLSTFNAVVTNIRRFYGDRINHLYIRIDPA